MTSGKDGFYFTDEILKSNEVTEELYHCGDHIYVKTFM